MALGADNKIIEDTPSEMVRVSRLELNKVLDTLDTLIDGIANAADAAAIIAVAAAIDTTTLRKVVATIERPAAPANPSF